MLLVVFCLGPAIEVCAQEIGYRINANSGGPLSARESNLQDFPDAKLALQPRDSLDSFNVGNGFGSNLGGPQTVGAQLIQEGDNRSTDYLLPGVGTRYLNPWFNFKENLAQRTGLDLGVDYATLYQTASSSLDGKDDEALAGTFRVFAKWHLLGRQTPNVGSLVVKGRAEAQDWNLNCSVWLGASSWLHGINFYWLSGRRLVYARTVLGTVF